MSDTLELVVLVGLPGAGKSSFVRRYFSTGHVLVSKDRMGRRSQKNELQRRLIEEALSQGRSVVVDNVNPHPDDRAPLIALAHAYGARAVAYTFRVSPSEALARNRRREGAARVPDVAVWAMNKRLVWPSVSEGFDAAYDVETPAPDRFVTRPMPSPPP